MKSKTLKQFLAEKRKADAAINGEQLDDLRVALVEAYRQTLMAKEPVLRYNLRKMEDMINGLDPEGPNQAQK